jgi:phosphoribosylformylglycinamidine synthase
MCFIDNTLGAKINSVFEIYATLNNLFAENIGIVFQAKDDAALERKPKANNVALSQNGER